VRGTRGRVRGARVADVGHTRPARRGQGDRRVWRPRPAPVRSGGYARSAGDEAAPPASVQGGGVAGAGQTGRAEGAPGVAPPPPAGVAVPRAPLGESARGGLGARCGGGRRAPASVQGPIKTGQVGPMGDGLGGHSLPAVTAPPLSPPPTRERPPLAPQSPSGLRVPTWTQWPWHPPGRRALRRLRR